MSKEADLRRLYVENGWESLNSESQDKFTIRPLPVFFTPMPEKRRIGREWADKYGWEYPPEKGGNKEYWAWWDRVSAPLRVPKQINQPLKGE